MKTAAETTWRMSNQTAAITQLDGTARRLSPPEEWVQENKKYWEICVKANISHKRNAQKRETNTQTTHTYTANVINLFCSEWKCIKSFFVVVFCYNFDILLKDRNFGAYLMWHVIFSLFLNFLFSIFFKLFVFFFFCLLLVCLWWKMSL